MSPYRVFFRPLVLVLFAASAAACGGAPAPKPAIAERKFEGKAARLAEDPRIGVYTSIPWGFRTKSYWIEGPEGLVFIDTQFLPSAAAESIDKAEAITSKKVKIAIVLHPNPDKFNGTSVFQERGIRVLTSAQVLEKIPSVHAQRKASFYDRYQPDYPADAAKPESFGDADTELSVAGVKVKVRVLGGGCSGAHVVVEYDGHAFVGDLVGNGTHAWLELGEVDEWLKRLAEIGADKPRFVHPGRGKSGGPELLAWESAYLQRVLEEVAKEKPTWPADPAAVERVKKRMLEAYPGLEYEIFMENGIEEVFHKQAEKAAGAH